MERAVRGIPVAFIRSMYEVPTLAKNRTLQRWSSEDSAELYGIRNWGAGYFDERYSPNVRLNAIEHEYTGGAFVTAFIEHKNVAGFTVKLSYRNLANMTDGFNRTVFVDRRDGPVAFSEQRLRRFGRFFQLTVTGTL